MDVPSLLRQAVDHNQDATAIVTAEHSLTFGTAWTRGVRLANALIDAGIKPGDRVGMVEDNNLGAVDLILGAAIAGAVRVPLYARNSRAAHRAMIGSTETKLVFTDEAYAASVVGLESGVGCLQNVIRRDKDYEPWLAAQSDQDPMVRVDPDDWYIIRHSSGTSGNPKGVGYRQHDWIANCRNWFLRLPRLDTDSVFGHAAPISHASGYLFIPTWLEGATNLLYGPFVPEAVLEMTERNRVTHTFLAPSMVAGLCAEPSSKKRDWSALTCILTGGAPITDATIGASRATFGDVLHQVFGQTEATPLTMMTPREWFSEIEGSTPLRSAGKVLPYARLEIRDMDGQLVPQGQEGEIYAQIEAQMSGYWNNPELSAQRLRDGWVRTGDIGRIDANGYLYVLDRVDDMIVSGGFNIWPSELETVIADHPEIREVAVFGIPHKKWGETPMAVCYVDQDAKVTSEEIIALVAERMGSYLKPSRVEFVQAPLRRRSSGRSCAEHCATPTGRTVIIVSAEPDQKVAISPPVIVERSTGVIRLTLNRPEKLNSISPESVDALGAALDDLRAEDRCVVVTGTGRAFCAGGDLEAVLGLASGSDASDAASAFHLSITRVLRRLELLPIPVVCAVNGLAVAGGIEIAAACDLVIADADARFADGHSTYGLLPGGGGSVRLPRIIGVNRAKLLMLTGRQVSAATMQEWGLVCIVAAPGTLAAEVDKVVSELLARSRDGLARMKALIDSGLGQPLDDALDREQTVTTEHTRSPDYAEGLLAFREKRAPRFLS